MKISLDCCGGNTHLGAHLNISGNWHLALARAPKKSSGLGPRQGCHTSCPSCCKQKQDPEAKPGPLAAIHMLRTQLAPCLGSETPETSRQWENEKKPWAHRLHASTALCQGLRRSCGFDISMRLSWAAAEALFFPPHLMLERLKRWWLYICRWAVLDVCPDRAGLTRTRRPSYSQHRGTIREFVSTRHKPGHFSSCSHPTLFFSAPILVPCHVVGSTEPQEKTPSQLFVIVIAENIFAGSETSVG